MTRPNADLSEWAALFLRMQDENATDATKIPEARYAGITPAARDLLLSVDAGGVPAFVTGHLRRIAQDNGIEVASHWTPNDIVAAIRQKADAGALLQRPP